MKYHILLFFIVSLCCITCKDKDDTGNSKYCLCDNSPLQYISSDTVNYVSAPNSFTPNGDSINETFAPFFYKDFTDTIGFIVYRGNEIVFRSQHKFDRWDGTYKGKDLPQGKYLVRVFAKFSNTPHPVNLSTVVSLLRTCTDNFDCALPDQYRGAPLNYPYYFLLRYFPTHDPLTRCP